VRARRSRLPGPADAAAAKRERPGPADRAGRFRALVEDYAVVLRSFPAGHGLFRALLGLHETENLKLAWRALSGGHSAARWVDLWRPLGRLETLRLEDWRDADSLLDALSRVGPPFGKVAAALYRSHRTRPADVEVALDRWASRRLLDEARSLPARESMARELALDLVRERDLDVVRRRLAFAMSPAVAAGTTVLLGEEAGLEPLRTLAAWTPAAGSLAASLPRGLRRRVNGRPMDWDDLATMLRRARRLACGRAFRSAPFHLGCAVAFLLLREEEERSWAALHEASTPRTGDGTLERVLAAGPMGA
jgi:hypothetical protein